MRNAAIVAVVIDRRRAGRRRADRHRGRRRRQGQRRRRASRSRRRRRAAPTKAAGRSRRSSSAAPSSSTAPARPGRPGRHRRLRQPHPGDSQRRHAGPAASRRTRAAERRSRGRRDRHVRPARIRQPARARRRGAEESRRRVSLQAVARARRHHRARRAADGSRPHRQRARRSNRNEIVAPRLVNYQRPGAGWDKGPIDTPEAAREWVRWGAANGIEGLKLGAQRPDIMAALLDEAKKHNLGSTAHLQQTGVAQMNALTAAKLGLQTVTHFYGHFEALLKDYVVQPWPVDQVNDDEQMRFGQVARLWDKIHPPGSPEWKAYLAGASQAQHDVRSDDDGVCGGPRSDAHAQRRLAFALHAAVADGLLLAEPQHARLRTGITGRSTTRSPGATSIRSGSGC